MSVVDFAVVVFHLLRFFPLVMCSVLCGYVVSIMIFYVVVSSSYLGGVFIPNDKKHAETVCLFLFV